MENAKRETLARKLHEYAKPRYNDGWDFFVECGIEYCREFCDGLETWPEVLAMAERIVDATEDQRADARYEIEAGG